MCDLICGEAFRMQAATVTAGEWQLLYDCCDGIRIVGNLAKCAAGRIRSRV